MKAMLKTLSWSVTLAVAGVVSEGCRQPSGAVMDTVIREMLCAPRMALTPCNPAWVLERREIHPLSAVQISQVRDLLRKCPVRHVPERYYRVPEEGNRDDYSEFVFYLYASNAQCLGGRLIGERALMDDMELSEEQQRQLYMLLRPQLRRLFPKEVKQ